MILRRIVVRASRGGALLASGLLLASAEIAIAQTTADLPIGARIRLRTPAIGLASTATAVVDALGADTLYVRDLRDRSGLSPGGRVAIPLSSVVQLDVSRGRRSRTSQVRAGALWGLAVYALTAGGYVLHERVTCRGPECFGEGFAWIGLAVGAPLAAGTGSVIGLSLPVERWHSIPLPSR